MDRTELPPRADYGIVASQISREIVRLHAKLYGRGPTKAKTYMSDDYALCILEDVFTPAEKTLIRAGIHEQVLATRNAFQDAVTDDFVKIVEAATGRSVRAFVSQIHIGVDAAFEMFLFEEEGKSSVDAPEESVSQDGG